MSVRYQKTPRGEVAILPKKEYELLVAKAAEADEDTGTARVVARARKEIASGGPLLPKDIVDRLADGENAVRVLREWRERDWPGGMTQMYLSHKTNLSQGISLTSRTAGARAPQPHFVSSPMHWKCRWTFLSKTLKRSATVSAYRDLAMG